MINDQPTVFAVSRDDDHRFSKPQTQKILLLAGLGVQGDAHAGTTVQHRSRVATDPTQPNLRQVHLIHAELFAELGEQGFDVQPGQLGENITTGNLDLLALPRGTQLRIGPEAVVEVTGLRNPCAQINTFQPRLLNAVLGRDDNGEVGAQGRDHGHRGNRRPGHAGGWHRGVPSRRTAPRTRVCVIQLEIEPRARPDCGLKARGCAETLASLENTLAPRATRGARKPG